MLKLATQKTVEFCFAIGILFFSNLLLADSVLNVSEFNVEKNNGTDSTYGVYQAIIAAKQQGASKLIFPKGTYHFYGDRAAEKVVYISNNDPGVKRIIFPLYDIQGLEIDGQGSEFIFHGGVNPFVIDSSSNITFSNFSMDFSRSFHSEGSVLDGGEGYLDLHFSDLFPYKINEAGLLKFQAKVENPPGKLTINKLERRKAVEKETDYQYKRVLEFDSRKRETAYMVKDISTGNGLSAINLPGKNNVRVFHPKITAQIGNVLVFQFKHRSYPAVVISDSADVILDNITIHHAGGMGVLGQRCHNVTVQNSKVTPSKGRMVSTTADATHFVNCTGKVQLINNLFENQKDDATNIHGIYVAVDKVIDDKTIEVRLQHPQQYGFDFIDSGDILELVDAPSMTTYATIEVASSHRISQEITRVVFTQPFNKKLKVGDSIAEVRDYAEVTIRGNIIRQNRARGMLLNSRGKTLVEDNYFHSPGSAILFEGDANFWYEQGGVSHAVIRNNVFDNSFYSQWGRGVIAVAAGIDKKYQHTSRYNKNIIIENNLFKVFDMAPILNLFSVSGVTFQNNNIEKTTEYPERDQYQSLFVVDHSDGVNISENNTFVGFDQNKTQLLTPTKPQ
ncbi:right-handed parallel beta-helix repeat-containing protein [Psychrosphaera sp. B3R10]|uniref:right-handed parallel beta-helix repeat-containing protein n=1 Tax=unclassified Psychrosphaera TaxID=2641570 RepID=UPI001C08E6DF|nr:MULTISPECIES: right-handed parallel beta-helix repeat-containing protein [unclassified Psychrosphaera]MBU2881736.1 right-handed parallel beta-helix repeat-containing protein [Psychrosphaera sp. I2R16]MBU2990079.1 right-handed parallel beta-helix repeat-containing protein [Psychrosphaera sp. B3R10]